MEDTNTSASTTRAVGRRKTAAARVRLTPGTGVFIINSRPLTDYFRTALLRQTAAAALTVLGKEKDYDLSIKVAGGGVAGQAEAVRHGIARALIIWNPDFRPLLKSHGYLTRDPRARERKKPGRHRARRGHQWKKR